MSDVTPVEPPPVNPPGVIETFWMRSATKSAMLLSVGLGMLIARPYLVAWLGDGAAVAAEGVMWAWLGAFGLHKGGPESRRA